MPLSDVTAVIKTFERPKRLDALLRSMHRLYPDLSAIVVDDGRIRNPRLFKENVGEYVETDFDIGLSAGRNTGVDRVATRYLLLMDDDVVFRSNTKIEKMLQRLDAGEADLCSGRQLDFGARENICHGSFARKGSTLFAYYAKRNERGLFDFTHNFFVARTDLVRSVRWDPELKLTEHFDFFLRMNAAGARITVEEESFYDHFPQRTIGYLKYRHRGHEAIALRKHGLSEVHHFKARRPMSPMNAARYVYGKVRSRFP